MMSNDYDEEGQEEEEEEEDGILNLPEEMDELMSGVAQAISGKFNQLLAGLKQQNDRLEGNLQDYEIALKASAKRISRLESQLGIAAKSNEQLQQSLDRTQRRVARIRLGSQEEIPYKQSGEGDDGEGGDEYMNASREELLDLIRVKDKANKRLLADSLTLFHKIGEIRQINGTKIKQLERKLHAYQAERYDLDSSIDSSGGGGGAVFSGTPSVNDNNHHHSTIVRRSDGPANAPPVPALMMEHGLSLSPEEEGAREQQEDVDSPAKSISPHNDHQYQAGAFSPHPHQKEIIVNETQLHPYPLADGGGDELAELAETIMPIEMLGGNDNEDDEDDGDDEELHDSLVDQLLHDGGEKRKNEEEDGREENDREEEEAMEEYSLRFFSMTKKKQTHELDGSNEPEGSGRTGWLTSNHKQPAKKLRVYRRNEADPHFGFSSPTASKSGKLIDPTLTTTSKKNAVPPQANQNPSSTFVAPRKQPIVIPPKKPIILRGQTPTHFPEGGSTSKTPMPLFPPTKSSFSNIPAASRSISSNQKTPAPPPPVSSTFYSATTSYTADQRRQHELRNANAANTTTPFAPPNSNPPGSNFRYQPVVRDKETRRHMHGTDCNCCSDYYRLTADVPQLQQAGALPSTREKVVSRHRVWSKRPDTPPGFWKVDFPSTQELQEDKEERLAKQMKKDLEDEELAKQLKKDLGE